MNGRRCFGYVLPGTVRACYSLLEKTAAAVRPRYGIKLMSEAFGPPDAPLGGGAGERSRGEGGPFYAALDLGTNNCRLLIARPSADGFRVSEAYSNIVRLGEGLTQTGRLQEHAMDRAMAALQVCADKIARRGCRRVRAVATQACRSAANGEAFVRRVREETGIRLQVISPREEASWPWPAASTCSTARPTQPW
jgi:exopolyphosphatase/guanosine-5'-triphosphate,3'-diphosphate pyrophosphatase